MLEEHVSPGSTRSALDMLSGGGREPLALIGIGCHFPGGATSPQAFWELLCAGTDATREAPPDRWDARKFYDPDPRKVGKMITRRGGYLERIDQFDPQFFGISPREAVWLDPQQRMLLRAAWETLEDAGQDADRLQGSDTGVFVGGFTLDYQLMQNFGVLSRYEFQANSATGMMMTMLANRISYVFGLQGPSMAVDTACSGSLVALHLACQSIWQGECSLALVGGVNAMLVPAMTIVESKGGFLSPDGRCKTFDASANGYARGEGAGMVLLKPLSQALVNGDCIYALIRGTAVTQDGHTTGITVPNGQAQEAAMRLAYQRAGIAPSQIQYIEAHGTGTPVGDPIEARAIGRVVSEGRPADRPCLVGSVKTNIGHLEAAAGIAGVIKVALALHHRQIPPHLHLHTPNPEIPFEQLHLRVPQTLEPWPETEGPALAGVNSFGFGGTNAHVVLEGGPPMLSHSAPVAEEARAMLLPLSARSPEALQDLARSYQKFLLTSAASLSDIVYSAAERRTHHEYRLGIVAGSKSEAAAQLEAFLAARLSASTPAGRVPNNGRPRIAFVCSGMGPQWWAMGRELLEKEPVFRASLERTDAEFQRHVSWSLIAALSASEAESRMDDAEVAQPTNFALQVALADLLVSWGIYPEAVVGHSAGEVAVHYLAGALSFADAVCVIYHRSRLQQRTTGQGRMLAVGLKIESIQQLVQDAGSSVSIAAMNSPGAITLVGEAALLEDMARQMETFQVFHRFLHGKVPYHSHFMEPIRAELLDALADLHPQRTTIPLYSTVTGTRIDGRAVDAAYWWQNVRATVLFGPALEQMIQDGYTVFLELSPHPVLASSIKELLALQGREGTVLPTLRRKEDDRVNLLSSLGSLYTHGYPIAWGAISQTAGHLVQLPLYPWQLKTCWIEPEESREDRLLTLVHPLLGQRMSLVSPTWELELNPRLLPYMQDHRIQGNVLLPGAAYAEMALAAAHEAFGEGEYALEGLTFEKALFLPETADPRIQTVVHRQEGRVEISSSSPSGENRPVLHATAHLRRCQTGQQFKYQELKDSFLAHCPEDMSREAFYELTRSMGFQYGPAFQAVESIKLGQTRSISDLHVPSSIEEDISAYFFHPSLLDAAFQTLLVAARPTESGEGQHTPYLPVSVDRICILARPTQDMQAFARITQADDRLVVGDILVVDQEGRLLAEIEGFRAQSLAALLRLTPEQIDRSLYELTWQLQEMAGDPEATARAASLAEQEGAWLVFTDEQGVGEALITTLQERGQQVYAVAHADVATLAGNAGRYTLNPVQPDQFAHLCAELTAPNRPAIARVVYLWSLDGARSELGTLAALEQDQTLVSLGAMFLVKALAQAGWTKLPKVWLVTRGAQLVDGQPGAIAIEQAPLWGLGRVVGHQEFASLWGGLVDLDRGLPANQAALLFQELWQSDGEDQVAYRQDRRYVARLVQSQRLTPPLPPTFRPDGSYLVTGGLGTLGLLVARWMVSQGARRVVLLGRTPLPPRSHWWQLAVDHPQKKLVQAILELEAQGASIHLAAVDVSDEAQLANFLTGFTRDGWPTIRGVVHTAGVVQDELLLRMSAETFQRVLRPKLRGGWLLHEQFKNYPLDFFWLFSSTGSVLASPGQANYAAANAFLDALAEYRRAQGLPALSLGWGPWSVGMVEQLHLEQFYTRRGIELITPEVGTQMMTRVMGQNAAHLVIISANWAVARASLPEGFWPPMLQLLDQQEGQAPGTGAEDEQELLARLRGMKAADRLGLIESSLQEMVARILQMEPEQLIAQEALTSLGMDSMMAIEIQTRIASAMRVDVSVLELLQGITVAQLAARLLTSLQLDEPGDLSTEREELAPDKLPDEIEELLALVDQEELERLLAELERNAEGVLDQPGSSQNLK